MHNRLALLIVYQRILRLSLLENHFYTNDQDLVYQALLGLKSNTLGHGIIHLIHQMTSVGYKSFTLSLSIFFLSDKGIVLSRHNYSCKKPTPLPHFLYILSVCSITFLNCRLSQNKNIIFFIPQLHPQIFYSLFLFQNVCTGKNFRYHIGQGLESHRL